MTFEPKKGQKYKDGKSTDDNFFMVIDYQDICEHSKMKIPDEMVADEEDLGALNKQMYQFNILYQVVVSCENGLTVGQTTSVMTPKVGSKNESHEQKMGAIIDHRHEDEETFEEGMEPRILQRSRVGVANVFFKLMHLDADGNLLINSQQLMVAEIINQKLIEAKDLSEKSEYSMTYIPFYDSTMTQEMKGNLVSIRVDPSIQERLRAHKARINQLKEELTAH